MLQLLLQKQYKYCKNSLKVTFLEMYGHLDLWIYFHVAFGEQGLKYNVCKDNTHSLEEMMQNMKACACEIVTSLNLSLLVLWAVTRC